jgi:hypothetical protein
MDGELDPYTPPKASLEMEHSPARQGWKIHDGKLWVKDGAELPDVCPYGSASPFHRNEIPITWLPRSLMILEAVSLLASSGMLLVSVIITQPTPVVVGQVLLVVALGAVVIDALTRLRLWTRHRIKIRRSIGLGVVVRLAMVLACYLVMAVLLFHLLNTWIVSQTMGQIAGIYLFMTVPRFLQSMVLLHAVEEKDSWYRLGGVSSSAIARLGQVQDGSGSGA